jgi:hypothetical protein
MGTYMKTRWTPLEFTSFPTFTTSFATTTNTGRSISYYTIDRKNGNTNSFKIEYMYKLID